MIVFLLIVGETVLTFAAGAGKPPCTGGNKAVMKRTFLSIALPLLVGASALLAGSRFRPAAVVGPQPTVSFAKAITSKSPVLYPNGLAAGDLNGDGFPDVAVVSFDNSQSMW